MVSLVEHAKYELELIDEEPAIIEQYLKIIEIFADGGHSGGSASVFIPVLNELLWHRNLSPLTNDPEEWEFHDEEKWGAPGGVWQNKRNSQAFSHDEGKTYYLVLENSINKNKIIHVSADKSSKEKVQNDSGA